jgi:hypothetical protein
MAEVRPVPRHDGTYEFDLIFACAAHAASGKSDGMRPHPCRRLPLVLTCLVALAGCGDESEDDQPFTITASKGTARIRCTGGDCAVGVVRDSGLFFVFGTRTVDGRTEERHLELPELTNVDIVTGAGIDSVLFNDAHVPGTVRISTGAGDDRLDLCDSSAGTATGIELGAGDDTFALGSGGYSDRFRMDTGPGDDNGYLEGLSFAEGRDIRIDGGDGLDGIDLGTDDPPAGVVVLNFEGLPRATPVTNP